jgi:4-amino-4-deoxy-L-arabinose transferase-like glycosyltransferase
VVDRRNRAALAALLLAAAAVRLAWVFAVDVDPRSGFHLDMTWYDLAAQRLLQGALLRGPDGTPTAFWPPGYPLLLAGAYALFGSHLAVAKLLNVALAVATCGFTYALAARLFGARAGLCAAAILAFLPDHVWYTPLLLSEVAFTALVAALLWLFCVWSERGAEGPRWIAFGALVGAATLVRGTAALFLAVPFAAWWLAERRARPALRRTLAASLGMLAVVAPWTLRNAAVMGAPIAVASSVGMSFLYTHNPHAEGTATLRHAAYRNELLGELRALPQPQREVAEMQAGLREGFAWMLANPGRELLLIPQRWGALFRHGHPGLEWALPRGPGALLDAGAPPRVLVSERADRGLALASDVLFFALLALAAAGVPGTLARGGAGALALPLTVAYVMLLHGVLLYGEPRYHAPLLPVLAVLAARGLFALPRLRPLLAASALAACALACGDPSARDTDPCADALAPLEQGFGARGPHEVRRERLASPVSPVWLYTPADAGAPPPVVVVAHAYDTGDPAMYRGLLEHLASRGHAAVFPEYMIEDTRHSARYDALWQGLATVVRERGARLDLTRLGVVGHSYGAGAAPWLLARARRDEGWGERGAFLLLLAPWYPLGLTAAELAAYPADVKALTLVFDDDTATDHRIGIGLFAALGVAEKDYLRVPGIAHGVCRLAAPHTLPQSSGLAARDDALDERALHRLLDALAAYAFSGDPAGRRVALGQGDVAQVDMGRWRDGSPLPRLLWSAAPSPALPEERYIFRASQRADWERYGEGEAAAPGNAPGGSSAEDVP